MKFRDYYEVLGVGKSAAQDEIRKAFRKLARKYHPDVAEDKASAEEKFKEINEAYEVLGDPEKRAKYDQLGAGWREAGAASRQGPDPSFWQQYGGAPEGGGWHYEGTGFSDFFETFFGTQAHAGGFPGGARAGSGTARRGRDMESEILVTLQEAIHGAERVVVVQSPGGGKQEITVRIPKGITEGKIIRAAGLGAPGSHGGPDGDLFLHVRLERHPDFRVEGHDVYFDLRVSPWEAILGATVPVRSPHGESKIKIPPGTTDGTEFRIAGKGLPKGKSGSEGDLFAVVNVVAPATAAPEERAHWEALAKSSTFNPRTR